MVSQHKEEELDSAALGCLPFATSCLFLEPRAHLQSPPPAFGECHQRGLRAAAAAPNPAQAEDHGPSSILPPFPWVPGRRIPKFHRCGLPVAQAFQYTVLLWCGWYDSAQRSPAGIRSPCPPTVIHSMCLCHVHADMFQYPACHCPTCLVARMAEPVARLGSYQRPRDISSNGRDTQMEKVVIETMIHSELSF